MWTFYNKRGNQLRQQKGGTGCLIASGTYVGDGSTSKAITGVGFKPKYVKIWNHPSAEGNAWMVDKLDQSWGDYADQLFPEIGEYYYYTYDNRINSLDEDGFTVDDGAGNSFPNTVGITYDWIAFGFGTPGVLDKTKQHDFPDWSLVDEIVFDSGWFALPNNAANTHRLAHGMGSEPDIVYLWCKATSSNSNYAPPPSLTPKMDSHTYNGGTHIVAFDGTNIDVHAVSNLLHWTDYLAQNCYASPELRVLGITKTPDYNSGWIQFTGVPTGTQVVKAHGLGQMPDFYTLELSDNSDGSGHHIYAMHGNCNHSGAASTVIVDVNSTNIIFTVGPNNGYEFSDYSNTLRAGPLTNWYYRVKAWTWTPNYTSEWFAVTTTLPREYVKQHNLGKIPYLAMLEFSKASDGSNDVVPMIGWSKYTADVYAHGLHISNIGENTVSVHNDDLNLAIYEDSGGAGQSLSSGYARVKLWA